MTQNESQRDLAVLYFNSTWALVDDPHRTAEQDRQMLLLACASRQLWGEIGGPTELATGDWQVAHVAALLGEADLSLMFAAAAYERALSGDVPRWLVASTCEGLARAHAAAGHTTERDEWAKRAHEHLAAVDDAEDRELIESQLATIE